MTKGIHTASFTKTKGIATITKESKMTDNNQELTGNDLLMYLMSRFNMTKQEALHSMRRAGHNTENL